MNADGLKLDLSVCSDSPERMAEMGAEERDARAFGITITELRKQRRDLGQLLTGPYAGCSSGFARTMILSEHISQLLRS